MTNEELIADWKAGKTVTVVEMGGFGHGYEVGIYEIAMAALEAMDADKFDYENDAKDLEKWREYTDKIEEKIESTMQYIQPSGAMFSAAMNIAAIYSRNGYENGMAKAPKDRIIELSNAMH